MEHLTVEEMIDFVSFDRIDEESLALAAKVNAHILSCDACRKKVAAFQTVYDEFAAMKVSGAFRKRVREMLDRNEDYAAKTILLDEDLENFSASSQAKKKTLKKNRNVSLLGSSD